MPCVCANCNKKITDCSEILCEHCLIEVFSRTQKEDNEFSDSEL